MKKRIFMGLTGLAIMAAAITATITTVNANSNDSDLLSQNLEALTQNEGFQEEEVEPFHYVDMQEDCPIYDPITGRLLRIARLYYCAGHEGDTCTSGDCR